MSSAYLEMWIRYCRQNKIWFAVCADGAIYQVDEPDWDEESEPDGKIMFGTKKAYEWLVRWHGAVKANRSESDGGQ